MIIKNIYNHLNANEYLIVNRPDQFEEIKSAINDINANDFLKISCEESKLGFVVYSQKMINKEIKKLLNSKGWRERRVYYYVTDDEATTREIVNIFNKDEQRRIIEDKGFRVIHLTIKLTLLRTELLLRCNSGNILVWLMIYT